MVKHSVRPRYDSSNVGQCSNARRDIAARYVLERAFVHSPTPETQNFWLDVVELTPSSRGSLFCMIMK
jgi:hypothetical protein